MSKSTWALIISALFNFALAVGSPFSLPPEWQTALRVVASCSLLLSCVGFLIAGVAPLQKWISQLNILKHIVLLLVVFVVCGGVGVCIMLLSRESSKGSLPPLNKQDSYDRGRVREQLVCKINTTAQKEIAEAGDTGAKSSRLRNGVMNRWRASIDTWTGFSRRLIAVKRARAIVKPRNCSLIKARMKLLPTWKRTTVSGNR